MVDKIKRTKKTTGNRKHAPYNLYLNELKNTIKPGWVMVLDDDDLLMSNTVIEDIVNMISNDDEMIMWKVKFPNRIIPSQKWFGQGILLNDFSMIGFMYHSKYNDIYEFDEYSGGDYYYASKLFKKIPNKLWIDKVYSGLQRRKNMGGFGQCDDLKK